MFEVVGSDIERLSDTELRAVVVRLAISELRKQGLPLSSITAGGHQDAADGGLDVRVQCDLPLIRPDFVPRPYTGFQVKKPDMAAAAIRDEMRPKGELRQVIAELATHHGAYIIVSAQGSLADKALRDRRQAMRDQLAGLSEASALHTDFYDRERIAAWVNEYPGTAAWVRARVSRPLHGWSSVDSWGGGLAKRPFLTDASRCLVDESRRPKEALPLADGITRLRTELRQPGRCVRLIGLSGLGKTRLVQALFDEEVGDDPLDLGLAIYTDYSSETRPTARDMARELIGRGESAILVVDNCNPETHAELAKLCSDARASISLLTVEYDVREDEPEHTDVFRLHAASNELLEKWIEQEFTHVTQVDRRTIAEFSHGNFRVARALAETLIRGETLGQVKSRDLFGRIFRQRNVEDKTLLMAAEDLALAYSVNGEDISEAGELAQLSLIRSISARELFEALAELRRRNVAQARGRWRAILPQAIANGLATHALERIHPDTIDRVMSTASPRLQASISRRLGNLHDCPSAQAAAGRWLAPSGAMGDLFRPSGDGIQIVTNLAPLVPAVVLERISLAIDANPEIIQKGAGHRWQWIRLIRALGYEPEHFVAAAALLARFLAAEPEGEKVDSARESFAGLFQLYLSGTEAPPIARREVVEAMLSSNAGAVQECGLVALEATLKTSYFSSSASFDFGARSRSWGWEPKLNREVWDWYIEAIRLCATAAERTPKARRILSGSVRGLWHIEACHAALEEVADAFVKKAPWVEGWIALRAALRYDGDSMPPAWRERLEALIHRLKPRELLHRARAAVLSRSLDGLDISDGEEDDETGMRPWDRAALIARVIGRELARDPSAREEFMAELMISEIQERAFECGLGLADGAPDLDEAWQTLVSDFEKLDADRRNATVLGGFIQRSYELDPSFANRVLEDAMQHGSLVHLLPYFQARVAIDSEGIERLRRAIAAASVEARDFQRIANGVVECSPPEDLARLLTELGSLSGGNIVALDILHMYFFSNSSTDLTAPKPLLEVGRQLLTELDPAQATGHRAHGLARVVKVCCSGDTGASNAVASALRVALEDGRVHFYESQQLINSLCEIQPENVLDVFVLAPPGDNAMWRWDMGGRKGLPYKLMPEGAITAWASVDPAKRYELLGEAVPLFTRGDFEEGSRIDPVFEDLLSLTPDKRSFLGSFDYRVRPSSWSGSLKAMLQGRRVELMHLAERFPGEVAAWVCDGMPRLDRWIATAGDLDLDHEESFE